MEEDIEDYNEEGIQSSSDEEHMHFEPSLDDEILIPLSTIDHYID